jgi:hypothetical protein
LNGVRALRAWPALAAAALTLTLAGHSAAFCLTRTCDPTTGMCVFEGQCNMSGQQLFWPSSCVSYDVQKDGSPKLGISYDTLHTIVVNAFAQWTSADCGDGTHPSILPTDLGAVDCAKPEYNQTQPNTNVITFHDDSPWPHPNALDTLALTTVFFNGKSGEIYDANVEINSADDNFVTDGTQSDFTQGGDPDLSAVLTHEIGHFLGLSHSDESSATMYGSYMPGMASLEPDDVSGICLALAPDRSVTGDSCTPRHGFGGDCGKPETGCCATAIGSGASTNQTLGLFAFGLGLCAWSARLRFRGSRRALRR